MIDSEILKVPAERVQTLIGEDGITERSIEQKCNVKLQIDKDGDVEITGDPADIFFAKDVIKAIGRGFPPNQALRLMDHDFNLFIIPLKDLTTSDKAMVRLKGRVIGENGKIKNRIEEATDSFLSIYGKDRKSVV
jgi:ribosomal RNA assembly protein